MPEDILMKIINGLMFVLTIILAWLMREHRNDYNKLRDDHGNHKLNVSEHYAKKSDLNVARMETNDSLSRIHDRIDALNANVEKKMDTIIGLVGHK